LLKQYVAQLIFFSKTLTRSFAFREYLAEDRDMKFPNLAWALKAKKLPQYRAARAVGISAAAFSRGLAGERQFTVEQRYAIAKLLDLSAVWLFSEIRAPRRRRVLTSQTRPEA
jgi:hypothetical protein